MRVSNLMIPDERIALCTALSIGHFTQSPHYSQSWHSGAELDAAFPYYGAHVQDQQYHFMSGTDSAQAFNMASSLGYGKDLSGYPPL